ncbi:MAG: 16S rRNA (uracil(1498)-N(3))-methyltransferase [Clostridia bacterium]|nr:16S rRNA (uracil(1498)-N(3))-methyltransferase [Clostridia bacterium]
MQKFFKNSRDIEQNEITLDGADARHICYSLRMAEGEKIVVCDGEGTDCLCRLVRLTGDSVTAEVLERRPSDTEPPYRAVLYQALAKGDKMDYIIQKATEFGVAEIVPFESARCIARIKEGGAEKKTARWQRIAEEAAKQCGRGRIPRISAPVEFRQAVGLAASEDGRAFICYENERTRSIAEIESAAEVYSFFIGPEGGFEEEEVRFAETAGVIPVGLGNRILRCESASGFVLSCLSFMNELGGQRR